MADRIEREINEILEKLDALPEDTSVPERRPISIAEHRVQRDRREPAPSAKPGRSLPAIALSPTHALLAGAGTVIGGLVLSSVWAPLIWAAFAGVAMFIGGFVAALFRRPRPAPQAQGGVYWRDRYIQYDTPPASSPLAKFKRRFRR